MSFIPPECSICQEKLAKKLCVPTACGHVFHEFCLLKWLSLKGRDKTCPNCRKSVCSRTITQLQFELEPYENLLQDCYTSSSSYNESINTLNKRLDEITNKYGKETEKTNKYKALYDEEKEEKKKLEDELKKQKEKKLKIKNEYINLKKKETHLEEEIKKLKDELDNKNLVEKYIVEMSGGKDTSESFKQLNKNMNKDELLDILQKHLHSICREKSLYKQKMEKWKIECFKLKAAHEVLEIKREEEIKKIIKEIDLKRKNKEKTLFNNTKQKKKKKKKKFQMEI